MNLSTGIKSKPAALEIISKALVKPTDEKVKLTAEQKAYNDAEAVLDKAAVDLAIARVKAAGDDVHAVNVTIRTSAGAQELVSVHMVKH